MDQGLKVDVALAKPKKEAIPIAKRAVKDGYDIVIAMGGDGTIGAVIRGMQVQRRNWESSLLGRKIILPEVWEFLRSKRSL